MLPPVIVNGKALRRGYTTGTCAAAAAKGAALLLFRGECPPRLEVRVPAGIALSLEISGVEKGAGFARCCVVKDAGDDPDVTGGLAVCATAKEIPRGIAIRGGPGVGTVTRPGLAVPPGEPAINPVPKEMIQREVGEVLPAGRGVEITVSVPGGEAAAKKTMNPRLGIVGGISILGTTGIVEPMSEEAYRASLVPQITQAAALGYRDLVLTPGRRGQRWAVERYGLPAGAVVQMGNFVGFMLGECARLGIKRVVLFGRLGKLMKVAAGIFHTHSRTADARREILVAHAALAGAEQKILCRLWESRTAEEAAEIVREAGLGRLFFRLAEEAAARAEEYVRGALAVGAVLTSLEGEILGLDKKARMIGESLGWSGLP
ncbi:MAG: cobalt-precorrin-5B (C(1))-methyltransferase CbiD [Desulfotomaculales bacterium]